MRPGRRRELSGRAPSQPGRDLRTSLHRLRCQAGTLPPGAFTRGGPISPLLLTTLLLYMVADAGRRGYGLLVSRFLDEAGGGIGRADGGFSGPAFCKARRKLPPAYMRWLLHRTADAFGARFGAGLRWLNGRRAFAVDGSKFNLRRHGGLRAAFGVPDGAH